MDKMSDKEQELCQIEIKRYNNYTSKRYKEKIRNELFLRMKPWMIRWIKSILKRWGKYETEEELLSISWDAFMYCLGKYSDYNVPIAWYFHNFTRYFLLMKYGKQDRVLINAEELQETLGLVQIPENILFDRLLTLNQFRDVLPEKYQLVWDDATQSLSKTMKEKTHQRNGIDKNMYSRLKASYIPIIKLILGIK